MIFRGATRFFLLILFLCAALQSKEADIVNLTDENFAEETRGYNLALILFYAPWCQHCQQFKPDFAKAAEEFLEYTPRVVFGQIDCTKPGEKTCNKYKINGYPTLKIFRNGEFISDYKGNRDLEDIVELMKKQAKPSSTELNSTQDLEKFILNQDEVSLVGIFYNNTKLREAFLNIADKLREEFKFAHTTKVNVGENKIVEDGVVLFRPKHLQNKFEDNFVIYTGDGDLEEIQKFIEENCHGLVGHRTQSNVEDFKNPLIVAYYNIDFQKNPKGTKYWRNRVLQVAVKFKNKITFAISSIDDFDHELDEFHVDNKTSDKPLILARDGNNKKYKMRDEFSVENLEVFAKNLDNGQLKPYVKSQPIPAANDDAVKVAVADNFEEVVINNGKDTLIEFYAPWCGHCKQLEPIYEKLAREMSDEDVEIVKIDATSNDIPDNFKVDGFPTLYWISKDSKDKPVPFDGDRELFDLIKFIAEHATEELKNFDRSARKKVEIKPKVEL